MSQRRLPAEIYWRRRLLLLAVLILIAWLGLHFWPGGNDERPVSAPVKVTPSPTPKPAPTDGTTTVALSSGSSACNPESIRITPSVPDDQHTHGPVDVDLTIGSTSKKPCTFTAASADVLVIISAGKTAIWDSTVCKTALLSDPVKLAPGWSTVVQAHWSGRGSGPRCSKKEGWATPGGYTIQVGTLGGEPGEARFTLTSAPKSEEKKSTKDDKSSDDKKADQKTDDKSQG